MRSCRELWGYSRARDQLGGLLIEERTPRARSTPRTTRAASDEAIPMPISAYHPRIEAATAHVLGRAFCGDPLFRWMVGGDVLKSTWCMRQGVRQIARGGACFVIGEETRGAACWLPPSAPRRVPLGWRLARGGWKAPFVCGVEGMMRILARESDANLRYEAHLREPTWVLDLLGVDPSHQGRGLGRALILHGLSLVDRDRAPTYLITYEESNVDFYREFGFEVVDFSGSPRLPTAWSLRRPAPGSMSSPGLRARETSPWVNGARDATTGDSLVERSALELGALVRRSEVSVEEVTAAFLERASAHDREVGAFATLAGEQALAAARRLDRDRRRRRPDGPLWGVPVGIKDINLVRGLPARMGSASLPWLIAPVDDEVARRVRAASLVVLGKTATSEYAILPFVDPAIHGPTKNPHDEDHYAGGSSGGSAAAVAARFLPLALGSDAAGSLRIPAAFCGLVTLKASRGALVSPHGRIDEARISAEGPIARDVLDAAALADVLRAASTGPSLLEQARVPPAAPLVIGVATRSALVGLHPEIGRVLHAFVARLAAIGHRIDRDDAPFVDGGVEEFLPLMQRMVRCAPALLPWRLEPLTRWMREQGALYDGPTVRHRAAALTRRVDEWFGALDAWVTPTVAIPPPRLGAFAGLPPRELYHAVAPLGAFTAPFNVAGYPAVSLPIGRMAGGLPIGAQLVMRPGSDGRLLGLARQLEAAGAFDAPGAP